MFEFAKTVRRKARKKYICDLCAGKIATKEEYVRYSGKYEGEYFDWKYHADCQAVIDAYLRETGECEYDAEAISDWLNDAVCCNLCDIETRDECYFSAFRCEKVLAKLCIKPIGGDADA